MSEFKSPEFRRIGKRPAKAWVCGRKSAGLARGSCVTAAPTPSGRFAAGLFEAVREDGLGVLDYPSIREHLIEI